MALTLGGETKIQNLKTQGPEDTEKKQLNLSVSGNGQEKQCGNSSSVSSVPCVSNSWRAKVSAIDREGADDQAENPAPTRPRLWVNFTQCEKGIGLAGSFLCLALAFWR